MAHVNSALHVVNTRQTLGMNVLRLSNRNNDTGVMAVESLLNWSNVKGFSMVTTITTSHFVMVTGLQLTTIA